MSMPMIWSAAARASSGVRASLIPPALPRPPGGTIPVLQAVVADPTTLCVLPRHRLSVLAEAEAPVVAPHGVTRRVLEIAFAKELEAELAADAVGRRVVDRGERMDGGAPGGGSSLLDGLRNRRRRDAAALILGQDSPSYLEHGLALPVPLPEVHPANRHTPRKQHDFEDVRRVGIDGGHVATVALFQLLGSLGAAQTLSHLRRVEPHQQRHVLVGPALEPDQLERYIAVPSGAAAALLAHGDPERADELGPGSTWLDHVVDVAALGGDVWVGKPLCVVADQLTALRGAGRQLAAEKDVHRALGPHDGYLRRRPRDVEIRPDVLRAHDAVGAAVGLARDHRQLRHRRFAERVQQLGPMADDAAVLLRCPR